MRAHPNARVMVLWWKVQRVKGHEIRVYKCCRCEDARDIKEVNDNTVEVYGLAVNGEVAKVDVSLTPLAMIRTDEPRTHDLFTVQPRNGSSRCGFCETSEEIRVYKCRHCEDAGNLKEVNDNTVEVDGPAVNGEVAKVDVSFTPLAMIRTDEPRTRDLFTVQPKRISSYICDSCDGNVFELICLQCDPCDFEVIKKSNMMTHELRDVYKFKN